MQFTTTRQIIFLSINYMDNTQFNPLRCNYHSSLVVMQLSFKICSWRPIANLVQCITGSIMKKMLSVDLSPNKTLSMCAILLIHDLAAYDIGNNQSTYPLMIRDDKLIFPHKGTITASTEQAGQFGRNKFT